MRSVNSDWVYQLPEITRGVRPIQIMKNRDESTSESAHAAVSLISDEERRDSRTSVDHEDLVKHKENISTTLRRAPNSVFLALVYAVIVLFAWAVTCIVSYKPISAETYVVHWYNRFDEIANTVLGKVSSLLSETERYLKAARVLQLIASLLTIPVTSAVCSWAAVAFRQQHKPGQQRLTLRRSMALADKGWTDPFLIIKIFGGRGRSRNTSADLKKKKKKFFYLSSSGNTCLIQDNKDSCG